MKLQEALNIIDSHDKNKGFRIIFHYKSPTGLDINFFPDNDESPIKNYSQARSLASLFHNANPNAFNIRVVNQDLQTTTDDGDITLNPYYTSKGN